MNLPAVSGVALGGHSTALCSVLVSTRDSGGGSALQLLNEGMNKSLVAAPMRDPGFSLTSRFSRAVLSPCGSHVVGGSSDGVLYAWSASSGSFEVAVGAGSGSRSGSSRPARRRPRKPSAASDLTGGAFAELEEEAQQELSGSEAGSSLSAREVHLSGHAGAAVHTVAYCADGSLLARGDAKGVVCVWEAPAPSPKEGDGAH